MSFVKEIEYENKSIREHEEARTTYSVANFDTGKRIQLQSYGRADREDPDKVSQVMQFTKESANQLIAILKKEFNI